MKLFGWRREASRPGLSASGSRGGGVGMGDWPPSYEAQVRDGYARNAIAQRAVKLVAESIGDAPVEASSPALLALATARMGGIRVLETVAAQLQLHGIPCARSTCR